MNVSCVACRARGTGMVAIYHHPNGLDQMFTSVTGIEVEDEDQLCIPCYDDLKAAHLFKQKCIQNNILRVSRPTIKSCPTEEANCHPPEAESTCSGNSSPPKTSIIPNAEISTTIAEADILEEHLEINSDVSEQDEDYDDDREIESEIHDKSLADKAKVTISEISDVPESAEDVKPPSIQLENTVVESNVEIVEEKQLIQCEICSKEFSKINLLNRHVKTSHGAAESTDDGEQSATAAVATLPTVHNLMCEYCFQEFAELTEKFTHETAHLSEAKPFKCPYCQSTFKDKVGLRSHIRIHSAVKRYKCQYCDMRFHQRGNLTAHERTHVGAKPYLCPHCGKGFAESGNLKNHIRYHTGERPYACSECPKRFRTHYSRTVHYRSHSNERPFRCAECDKGFYSSGKLIIHRRVHSGEKPYKCSSCPAKFADSSGLRRHAKTH